MKLSSKKILFFENFLTILLLDYWKYAYTVKLRMHFANAEHFIFLSSRPFRYASKALHGFMSIIYIYKQN